MAEMLKTDSFFWRKFWIPWSLRGGVGGGSLNVLLNFHPVFKHLLFLATSHLITPKTVFSYKLGDVGWEWGWVKHFSFC